MLFESFLVYTFFALMMYGCALSVQTKASVSSINSRMKFPKGYIQCLLLFFLIAGLRYDVGVDYLSYLNSYEQALKGHFFIRSRGLEESYVFLTTLFGKLGIHPIIYFGFIAATQLFLVMYTYKEERSIMPYMMLLLILGTTFFIWMNGVRQAVASCFFVFSIKYIKDKRLMPFLLCMLLALSWHRSSAILIPFYFLSYNKKVWNKTWVLVGLVLICFILGNTPIWIDSFTNLGRALSMIGYGYYSDQLEMLVDNQGFSSFSLGPRMLSLLGSYIIIVIMYPKARHLFPDSFIDITFKLCYIGICGYLLFCNTNLYFLRPVSHFTIFSLPMLAYILTYLKKSSYQILFLLLLLFSLSSTYLSCVSDARVAKEERKSYLYHFYFEKDKL